MNVDDFVRYVTGKTYRDLCDALVAAGPAGKHVADQVESAVWHLESMVRQFDQAMDQAMRDLMQARDWLQRGRINNISGVLQHNGTKVDIFSGRTEDAKTRLTATLALARHILDPSKE